MGGDGSRWRRERGAAMGASLHSIEGWKSRGKNRTFVFYQGKTWQIKRVSRCERLTSIEELVVNKDWQSAQEPTSGWLSIREHNLSQQLTLLWSQSGTTTDCQMENFPSILHINTFNIRSVAHGDWFFYKVVLRGQLTFEVGLFINIFKVNFLEIN